MQAAALPPPLAPGACIGVVAPAGPAAPEAVAQVEGWLQGQGFAARVYPGCFEHAGLLAGPDARRLQDLHDAFTDPAVHGIVCLRGGYGSARLLDALDFALVARHPKPLVGYSDISALHAAFTQRAGLATWHAPMLSSDLLKPDGAELLGPWRAALLEPWPRGRALPHGNAPTLRTVVPGVAQGPLVGGNLATLVALEGTPYALDTRGAVLFIEDVDEALYRVDRLLTQWRLAGRLQAAAGFVVGSFTGTPDGPGGTDVDALVDAFLRPLGKPVLAGWPSGHGRPNRPLPLGVAVRLDAGARTLSLA